MPGKKWDGNLLQGLIVCQKKIGHEKDPKISSIRFGGKIPAVSETSSPKRNGLANSGGGRSNGRTAGSHLKMVKKSLQS